MSINKKKKNYFDQTLIPTIGNIVQHGDYIEIINGYYANGTSKKLKDLCPDMVVGEEYVLFVNTTSALRKFIYLIPYNASWNSSKSMVVTQEMLDSTVYVYGRSSVDDDFDLNNPTIINSIQIFKTSDLFVNNQSILYKGDHKPAALKIGNGERVDYEGYNLLDVNNVTIDRCIKIDDETFQTNIIDSYYCSLFIDNKNMLDPIRDAFNEGKTVCWQIGKPDDSNATNRLVSIVLYGTFSESSVRTVERNIVNKLVSISQNTVKNVYGYDNFSILDLVRIELRFNRAGSPITDRTTIYKYPMLFISDDPNEGVRKYEPYTGGKPVKNGTVMDYLRTSREGSTYMEIDSKYNVESMNLKAYGECQQEMADGYNLFNAYDFIHTKRTGSDEYNIDYLYSETTTHAYKINNSNSFDTKGWATDVFDNEWVINTFKPGAIYHFSCDVELLKNRNETTFPHSWSYSTGFLLYNPKGLPYKYLWDDLSYQMTKVGDKMHVWKTFQVPDDISDPENGYKILLYTRRWVAQSGVAEPAACDTLRFSNVQIVESTQTSIEIPYEPYTGGESIPNPEHHVPVIHNNATYRIRGKNLFPAVDYSKDFVGEFYSNRGRIEFNKDNICIYPYIRYSSESIGGSTDIAWYFETKNQVYLLPGDYTLSFKFNKVDLDSFPYLQFSENINAKWQSIIKDINSGNSAKIYSPYIFMDAESGVSKTKFTINNPGMYVVHIGVDSPNMYSSSLNGHLEISEIQIETGNIGSKYEPYVEPKEYNIDLYGINNYKDEVNWETGEVTRRVYKRVLNSETPKNAIRTMAQSNGSHIAFTDEGQIFGSDMRYGYSPQMKYSQPHYWNALTHGEFSVYSGANQSIWFKIDDMYSDVDYINYVKENPLEFYVMRKTPVIEKLTDYTPPSQFYGTMIIEQISGDIPDTKFVAEYTVPHQIPHDYIPLKNITAKYEYRQAIDTDVPADNNTSIETKFRNNLYYNRWSIFLGASSLTGDGNWILLANASGQRGVRFNYGVSATYYQYMGINYDDYEPHKYYISSEPTSDGKYMGYILVDDKIYMSEQAPTAAFTTAPQTITIFTQENANGYNLTTFGTSATCYYFKCWKNGELIRDMKPCLDPDGVPCMYDIVEGKPHYNVGNGMFGYETLEGFVVEPVAAATMSLDDEDEYNEENEYYEGNEPEENNDDEIEEVTEWSEITPE